MHCSALRPCVGFNCALMCLRDISELSCLQSSRPVGSFFVILCFKRKKHPFSHESLATVLTCMSSKRLSYVKSWILQLTIIFGGRQSTTTYCYSASRPRQSCGSSQPSSVSESLKLPKKKEIWLLAWRKQHWQSCMHQLASVLSISLGQKLA